MFHSLLLRDKFCDWSRANVNFLDTKLEPAGVLSVRHTLALVIENSMKKFYEKELVGITIFEALKFCATA